MAAFGLKPVAEIQFEGFMPPAFDQLVSHAARLRNRTRGRITIPLVVRSPYGGGIKALEHHSDSPEAYYAHTPGLKVVIPSNPYDAKGLLVSAIRDPDPVIFFEPKKIYRAIKQEVPDEEYTIPIGKANVVKEGEDITVITFGSWVRNALEAAEKLTDVSVEVLDLRTISPLDEEAIINSVAKTGRCIIVHEAPRSFSVSSEVSAIINEHCLLDLKAPVKRLTGYDIIMPLPKLEDYNLPSSDKIVNGIRKVMSF